MGLCAILPRNLSSKDAPTPVNVADWSLSKSTKGPGKGKFAQSLISETLKDMESDEDFKATAEALKKLGQAKMTLEERKKRRRALDDMGAPAFHEFVANEGLKISRADPEILQLNIGLYCNQACNHCHVESSPKRTESMSMEIAMRCLELLDRSESFKTLDLTGGAPELNPTFRFLVEEGRKRGLEIIDRCNLTVLVEPGQEDLAQFLADHQVRVIASLPCYSEKNVNTQRGRGVFDRSIEGLRQLCALGYGTDEGLKRGLGLDLVYNPGGAFLPPAQTALEEQYREQLLNDFGLVFNNLYTITNMPIKRFADFLYRRGELTEYMELLVRNFNSHTIDGLMCRNTVSVDWDGKIFDCDFNQQMAIPLGVELPDLSETANKKEGRTKGGLGVFDIESLDFREVEITTDYHCFGCTAGAGSS